MRVPLLTLFSVHLEKYSGTIYSTIDIRRHAVGFVPLKSLLGLALLLLFFRLNEITP